ncbi:primosomal replication protein PriC [Pseudidiomarina sp.]|uniref:primosomal replication protein PriC n=1 Tax=Pseudidiomarina sp. TaxID=2081707 RepID=UPI003A9739CA
MTLNPTLKERIEAEINALEQRIKRLNINEEQFSDWFDSQLFSQDATTPADYIRELRQHLRSLTSPTTTARSQWLSERVAHQLSALHQAVRWHEQRL